MSENAAEASVEIEALYEIQVFLFPSGEVTLAVTSSAGEPEGKLVIESLEAAIRIASKSSPVAKPSLN